MAIYYILATAEASSNLARYDGVKYGLRSKGYRDLMEMYTQTRAKGFGEEVKRRIILGTYVLSAGYYEAYYRKASQVRTLMRKDFEEVFQKVDVVLAPTAPTPAFRIGEKTEDPLQMYLSDIHTIPVNLAGIPAISIPCGFSHEGLPIGLQIMGKHFDEGMLLRVAYTFEQNTDFHLKKPKPYLRVQGIEPACRQAGIPGFEGFIFLFSLLFYFLPFGLFFWFLLEPLTP